MQVYRGLLIIATILGIEEQHGPHQAESTHPPVEGNHRTRQGSPTGTEDQSHQPMRHPQHQGTSEDLVSTSHDRIIIFIFFL